MESNVDFPWDADSRPCTSQNITCVCSHGAERDRPSEVFFKVRSGVKVHTEFLKNQCLSSSLEASSRFKITKLLHTSYSTTDNNCENKITCQERLLWLVKREIGEWSRVPVFWASHDEWEVNMEKKNLFYFLNACYWFYYEWFIYNFIFNEIIYDLIYSPIFFSA